MTSAKAIREYMQQGDHGRPVKATELVAFKKSMSPDEWHELGAQACDALGVDHEVQDN